MHHERLHELVSGNPAADNISSSEDDESDESSASDIVYSDESGDDSTEELYEEVYGYVPGQYGYVDPNEERPLIVNHRYQGSDIDEGFSDDESCPVKYSNL